jgi:hypothetical protein
MDNKLSQNPILIANASGFPLQIAIAKVINQSTKWHISLEEHPWRLDLTGEEGFIDLVVTDRVSPFETFVIECKRVRQTAWVFLLPKSSSQFQKWSQSTIFGSDYSDSKWKHFGWEDWQSEPITFQSQYCAIPGQDGGRKTLLERTASELVFSVEALAYQERALQKANSINCFSRVYIPVIVTTAQLIVSEFDPAEISLEDGSLPKETLFKEVSFIRYRKSLTTFTNSTIAKSIHDLHIESERTIFVVNAKYFGSFLDQYEFRD